MFYIIRTYYKIFFWKVKALWLFIKLQQKHKTCINIKLVFERLSIQNVGEIPKANSTVDITNLNAIIRVDICNHASFSDVEESIYHEYRHVMQYRLLKIEDIVFYSNRAKESRLFYRHSPMEIDAMVFAKNRGELVEMEIFEKFGNVSDFSSERDFWNNCEQLAKQYDLG